MRWSPEFFHPALDCHAPHSTAWGSEPCCAWTPIDGRAGVSAMAQEGCGV
ncbi:hypothetical protein BOO71_0002626 [Deinococcus marmoris]|uniref:Uncharacterized protein n=1 Tax=Deinococcus marmoris TaxID=249408 RepID=A0A1U7P2V2_9DEIO|nr:hypothetical protein BOO71_0002626 [Deinococcus marmoris]